MLILQRRPGEKVMIGDDISVSLVSIDGNRVRLAISAPREVPIFRGELLEAEAANRDSADEMVGPAELLTLLDKQGILPPKGGEVHTQAGPITEPVPGET